MAKIHNEQRVLGVNILEGGAGTGGGAGSTTDAKYADPTGAANGSTVALLKGIYVQNVAIIALLNDIKTNTAA